MICIIALVVFGILAVFSASHRPLAKEAFECVFLRLTLRQCRTGLDTRLKSQIVGSVMSKSPFLARILYQHFEIFSWALVLLTVVSLGYAIYGGYNYYLYGNCYGPEYTGGFCIYNALEGESVTELQTQSEGEIEKPTPDTDPSIGLSNAKATVIEFGCYSCPYSRQAQPIVQELLDKYKDKIRFVYRDFPVDDIHKTATLFAESANCALEQNQFWKYHDALFTTQEVCAQENEDPLVHIFTIAKETGLDIGQFKTCLESREYKEEVQKDFNDGIKAGVHGTPTFFINGRMIIGPKPIRAFEKIIDEELSK